jgi:hypothetical protein
LAETEDCRGAIIRFRVNSATQQMISAPEARRKKPVTLCFIRRTHSHLIVLAAALLISAGDIGIASAADQPETIHGVWKGRYVCGQGPTGATLTISSISTPWLGVQVYLDLLLTHLLVGPYAKPQDDQDKGVKQITARFRFYALSENPGVPSGEYELSGRFDPVLGLVDLKPSKWIDRPDNYNMVALRGVLEEDGQTLKGAMDAEGCGIIVLRTAGEATHPQPAQPSRSAQGSAPSVPAEFSEELLKLDHQIFQLHQAHQYDQAIPIARRAVTLAERLYGPDHPTIAAELRFLVQALQPAGRSAEAEPLMRRALAIDEKNVNPNDPLLAFDLKILTGLLVDISWNRVLPQADRGRVALTGQLPLVLERAVPLALLLSLFLLWMYLRAVKRSMRRQGAGTPAPTSITTEMPLASKAPELPLQIVTMGGPAEGGPTARRIESHTLAGPWRNATIYTIAGLSYALTLTVFKLSAGGQEYLLLRVLLIALTYAWPVVLTVGIVAAISWRSWLTAAAVYLLLFVAISVAEMARTNAFTWDQPIRLCLLTNLPGTFLLLAFLPRPIRAVGPMVLAFMIAAVAGTTVWQNVFEVSSPRLMLPLMDLFSWLGLSDTQAADAATYALQLIGALVFGLIVWALLRGLGSLYRMRWVSDQSVLVDSIWLLFAVTAAIDFALFGLAWFLAPFAAFAVYKLVALLGFALLREQPADVVRDPKLLLLRVFSLGRRSARLFNAFGKLWRCAGSIRLIAGPDLATSTVEPNEFLDFLGGKLSRRFISGPETLNQRLAETEPHRDFDGRYRVSDFFCHDDTWKMVLGRLARDSNPVLMDLRGLSPSNKGCVFEIDELLNVVPLNRVVFVVDETTDIAFLREIFAHGWAALRADSPNRESAEPRVQLFQFTGIGNGSVPSLARVVAGAATSETTDEIERDYTPAVA